MKNNTFVKNTLMLYILTASNYLFNFITIPYLTRVLGPVIYGKIGVGLAFAAYMQLLFDFGFMIYATAEIAKVKDDINAMSKIYWTVLYSKLFIVIISGIFLLCVSFCFKIGGEDFLMYLLFWAYMAVNCLIPDYLYRGIERMNTITYRSILMKSVFTVCIFIFVKNMSQYLLVPLFYLFGSLFSFAYIAYDVKNSISIKYVKIKVIDIINILKSSGMFFLSRIASTVYTTANIVILNLFFPNSNIVGYYSASEKIITAGRSMITPISDSLYPYMVKNKRYDIAKKIMMVGIITLITGCTVVGIFAESVCTVLFGKEYTSAATILRLTLPLIIISLPSYVIAFPVLTPLGMVKYANISVIIGAICQIAFVFILYIQNNLNAYSICVVTCITELIVLILRIIAMIKGLNKTKCNSDIF